VYFTFRVDAQPFGTSQDDADPDKSLAIRQALAHLIDRQQLSEMAYGGTLEPAYSYIPKGLVGHSEILRSSYGDLSGLASPTKARDILNANGVSMPVVLRLAYSPDRYGDMSETLVNVFKDQIEKDGIFELEVSTAEWSALREIRTAEVSDFDMFLLHWGPDFGESDNYLSPVLSSNGWLGTQYSNAELDKLMAAQVSIVDEAERAAAINEIEKILATQLPAIVIGMDGRSALVRNNISGLESVLDVSFKVRFGYLSRD
jgi:peptide/nickel transport system substrate-binding protein